MSLTAKIDAWAKSQKGQAKIKATLERYVKEGRKTTAAGTPIISEAKINEIVSKLIRCIMTTAASYDLPPSVMEHINSMNAGSPVLISGHYEVPIYFGGDMHRESLEPERFNGVQNIVAIFNNGYDASGSVYGVWKGHTDEPIFSKRNRIGLHFIQQAVDDFNGNYGSDYDVTVEISGVYE